MFSSCSHAELGSPSPPAPRNSQLASVTCGTSGMWRSGCCMTLELQSEAALQISASVSLNTHSEGSQLPHKTSHPPETVTLEKPHLESLQCQPSQPRGCPYRGTRYMGEVSWDPPGHLVAKPRDLSQCHVKSHPAETTRIRGPQNRYQMMVVLNH